VAAFKNRADAEAAYDAINAWFAARPKGEYSEKKYRAWFSLVPCCMVEYVCMTDQEYKSSMYAVNDLNLDIKETVLLSKFK